VRDGTGSLVLRGGVSIYGGFSGAETQRDERDYVNNVTVIDGSKAAGGAPASRVVVGTSFARLDGFTITGGRGVSGCGLFNNGVSPTIANCVFADNRADEFGGAMFNLGGANPAVTNCTFTDNSAERSGGAIHNLESSAQITNCVFSRNR